VGELGLLFACVAGFALLISGAAKCLRLVRSVRQGRVPRRTEPGAGTSLSFSLLVPARSEASALERTLHRLAATPHPAVEILVLVSADDPGTLAAADRAATAWPGRIRMITDPPGTRGKPEALTAALAECCHEITGVFDADGAVHPDLLIEVDAMFADHQLDALQAANQPLAARPAWYQLHNMVEFFAMFLASHQPAPSAARLVRLSGNSVFFRTELIRSIGGWPGGWLAEDCEISLRLAAAGARVQVWRPSGLQTVEEVPPRLGAFVRQRTRWNQGFLQVLGRGSWRQLGEGRHRWQALRFLSEAPARAAGVVLIALTALLAGPLWPAAVLAAGPAALLGTVNTLLLVWLARRMRAEFGLPARRSDVLALLAGALPFQALLSLAAIRACTRQLGGRGDWEKTEHTGAALDLPTQPAVD
jgi:glycosyltransferase XagB